MPHGHGQSTLVVAVRQRGLPHAEAPKTMTIPLEETGPDMWISRMDVFLSRWFATYQDARRALDTDGGYLLPYGNQFFITVADAIRELGLDPDDPDWAAIGFDWVRPADRGAWDRLRLKREVAG